MWLEAKTLGRQGGCASLISEILGLGLFFWLQVTGGVTRGQASNHPVGQESEPGPEGGGLARARGRTGGLGAAGEAHRGGRQAPALLSEPRADSRTQLSFGATDPKPSGIKAFFRCCQMMSVKATASVSALGSNHVRDEANWIIIHFIGYLFLEQSNNYM